MTESFGDTFIRGSTPARGKATGSSEAQFGYTEAQREAALVDAETSAQLVDLDFFLDALLPPLDPALLTQVIEKLKTGPRPYICKTGRLRGFPINPAQSDRNEDKTFRPLAAAINASIAAAASADRKSSLEYRSNPNIVPESQSRVSLSRPDGSLVLNGCDLAWINIACCAELKPDDRELSIRDNIRKIVWSLYQIMRDDERRRFGFGFTIEDVNMRLWFGSRGRLFASEPFNFIIDHKPFIHFFLSLAYSKEHKLGWDPNMTRLPTGQLDIQVQCASGIVLTYRTEKVLSNYSADCLLSRGTRVWQARLVKKNGAAVDPGDCVALKDTWIDSNREREGEIHRNIRRSLDNKQRKVFDTFFFTVLHDGDAYVEDGGGAYLDDCLLPLHHRSIPTDIRRFDLKKMPPLKKNPDVAEGQHFFSFEDSYSSQEDACPRGNLVHYRIVFQEVCTPIFKLSSMATVCRVLSQVCAPLSLLHNAKWVHRDLSIANLFVDKFGGAKVGDLEYAVRMDTTSVVHSIRTASQFFMAIEVQKNGYHFYLPRKTEKPLSCCSDEYAMAIAARNQNNGTELRRSARLQSEVTQSILTPQNSLQEDECIPFRHNPLHDLESLWWIAAYFLLKRRITISTDIEWATLGAAAGKLFVQREEFFFGHRDRFKQACNHLNPRLKPLGGSLDRWRIQCCELYKRVEENPTTIDHRVADAMRRSLIKIFYDAGQELSTGDIILERWRPQREDGNKLRLEPAPSDQDENVSTTSTEEFPSAHNAQLSSNATRTKSTNPTESRERSQVNAGQTGSPSKRPRSLLETTSMRAELGPLMKKPKLTRRKSAYAREPKSAGRATRNRTV